MNQSISTVKAQVRAFIDDNFIMGAQSQKFGDQASFLEHHIIDSTGFLELVTFIALMQLLHRLGSYYPAAATVG